MDIIIIIIALTTTAAASEAAAATIKCASVESAQKCRDRLNVLYSVQNRMSHVHCCFVHTKKPMSTLAVAAAATVTFTLTSAYPRSNSTLVQEHNHTHIAPPSLLLSPSVTQNHIDTQTLTALSPAQTLQMSIHVDLFHFSLVCRTRLNTRKIIII